MSAQKSASDAASILKQIAQHEQVVQLENKRLKQLLSIQDALIEKQRSVLCDVAAKAQELRKLEDEREKLRNKLNQQKTQLLVAGSESQDVSELIETVLGEDSVVPEVSESPAGENTLKVIEQIQASVFELTQACLNSPDLSVSPDQVTALITDVNNMIDEAVNNGLAKESPEDTIRRQSFVITSMIQEPTDGTEV